MPTRSLEDELHRLLERFEENPEGRLFAPLADCYRKLGRQDEAYRLCVDGLARHPDYSTGFVILGKIHLDRGELDEARTAFETVLSLDPENLIALESLARLAEEKGEIEAARRYARQLAELDPRRKSGEEQRERAAETTVPETDEEQSAAQETSAEADEDHPTAGGPAPEADDRAPSTAEREDAAEVLVARSVDDSAEEAEEDAEVLTAMSRNDSLQNDPEDFDPEGIFEGQTIVTVTLADVYYEQGFKAKALEMYRAVLRRHPDAPGVAAKVAAIEEELSSLQHRFEHGGGAEVLEEKVEDLETPLEGEKDEGRDSRGARPQDDLEEDVGEDERERFQSWIARHRKDKS